MHQVVVVGRTPRRGNQIKGASTKSRRRSVLRLAKDVRGQGEHQSNCDLVH